MLDFLTNPFYVYLVYSIMEFKPFFYTLLPILAFGALSSAGAMVCCVGEKGSGNFRPGWVEEVLALAKKCLVFFLLATALTQVLLCFTPTEETLKKVFVVSGGATVIKTVGESEQVAELNKASIKVLEQANRWLDSFEKEGQIEAPSNKK